MFSHIFKYRIKCLLRDRVTVFWTLMFPLVLATFFNLAFSNLDDHEKFQPINIAVADNEAYRSNQGLKSVLGEVSTGDDRLFNLAIVSQEEADRLLFENSIAGYLAVDTSIKLVVNKSGLNQSIIKSFIDSYLQTNSTVTSIITDNPSKYPEIVNDIGNRKEYVREVSGTSAEPNAMLNYFYTLIAMACFYGGLQGSREVSDIQANISYIATRVNTVPVHKLKIFLYNMCASLFIHYAQILVLLTYLYFGLKIDFGTKWVLVLLTAFIGSIVGLSFGAFISAAAKKSEGVKIAVIIGVSMICSFLAGMMYQGVKYIVAQKIPVLSWLNPLNLLTDAFYSLYYYDTLNRYTLNMIVLTAFIPIFCLGTYFMIRRRKYASL